MMIPRFDVTCFQKILLYYLNLKKAANLADELVLSKIAEDQMMSQNVNGRFLHCRTRSDSEMQRKLRHQLFTEF